MRCQVPRSPADRTAAPPVSQAKADPAPRLGPAPAGPAIGGEMAGFSFADVPVHAPSATVPGRGGLPPALKAGVEQLSGLAMDDVSVHRDSPEPARLGALAFARGSEIHLGPGQDRHLPHEAWHVVQQMQGRVQATKQMKGVPLNDQAPLETEADFMGAAAAVHQSPARIPRAVSAVASPVMQAKIIHKGKPLSPPLPGEEDKRSRTVRHYDDLPEGFVLKDTDEPEWKRVHLLESPKRYLIGESHDVEGDIAGTSRWAITIAGWTDVTKVREGEHTSVSYGPEILANVVATASHHRKKKEDPVSHTDKDGQPALENIHEWLLGSLAASIEVLKDFYPENIQRNLLFRRPRLKNDLDELKAYLSELSVEWYNDYILAYEALVALDEIKPSSDLNDLYNFHIEFRDRYRQSIIDMKVQATLLKIVLERSQNRGKNKIFDEEYEDKRVHIGKIMECREVLVILLDDFLKLSKVTMEEYDKIANGLFALPPEGEKPVADTDKSLELTSPPRERAMISNLKNIPADKCPVLVQIGDDHVENVKAGLGDLGVAVRQDEELNSVIVHRHPPK